MSVNKIKSKIAAIIAKANGTDNMHERHAFMSKAQQLLNEHQLEAWDLDEEDIMGATTYGAIRRKIPVWESRLYNVTCTFYGAQLVRTARPGGRQLTCYGRESSRVTVELMFPFIVKQVREQAKEFQKEHPFIGTKEAIHHVGCALARRMWVIIENNKAAAQTPASKNALVVVNEAEAYVASIFENLIDIKNNRSFALAATSYAENVSLHRQTTNANNTLAIK